MQLLHVSTINYFTEISIMPQTSVVAWRYSSAHL